MTKNKSLYILDDDNVSFAHVTETLMDVCNFSIHQAEQCAYLTHEFGGCKIKESNSDYINMLKMEILDKGIKVKVV